MVDAPGWSSPIPTVVASAAGSADSSPASSNDTMSSSTWRYPLHERFQTSLDRATCVPLLRLPFQNYGLRELPLDESITDRQTVRDRVPANFHTYGKVRILSSSTCAHHGMLTCLTLRCLSIPRATRPEAVGWALVSSRGLRLHEQLFLIFSEQTRARCRRVPSFSTRTARTSSTKKAPTPTTACHYHKRLST